MKNEPTKKQRKFFKDLYKLCREYHVNITLGGNYEFYEPADTSMPVAVYNGVDMTGAYKINEGNAALTVEYIIEPAQVIKLSVMGDGNVQCDK